jgi:hypothetical protein
LPNVHDDSPATGTLSSPGYAPLVSAGETDPWSDLIAQSQRAADLLAATVDRDAHDAAMAALMAESDAAAHHLALLMDEQQAGSTPSVGTVSTRPVTRRPE